MKERFKPRKFLDLLLYICLQSIGDKKFSEEKAMWMAFYADNISFLQTGKSITGATYLADKKHGIPAPKQSFK